MALQQIRLDSQSQGAVTSSQLPNAISKGWQWVESQAPSAAASVSFTSLSENVRYRVTYDLKVTGNSAFYIRFNNDSTNGRYAWGMHGQMNNGATSDQSGSADGIRPYSSAALTTGIWMPGHFEFICFTESSLGRATLYGQGYFHRNDGPTVIAEYHGYYSTTTSSPVTSVQFLPSSSGMTGNISLSKYQY